MQDIMLVREERSFRIKEAYRTLRTNIGFCGEEVKVICVTSCAPNEGKSSISYDLACAFADSGKKTLLVDGDLRKSIMGAKIKMGKVHAGMTDYLAAKAPLDDIICKTNKSNLYMVFAGPVPPNPSELLGHARFGKLVSASRNAFDIIIIDTPPLYGVIDTAVIAKQCDGAIIVVESKSTSYHIARKIRDQLTLADCRILGCVLNKVEIDGKGYYGRYYGEYYGNY